LKTDLPSNWAEVEFGEINDFQSETLDPSQFREEEFELYSVPSFPAGRPELVTGAQIGSTKQVVYPGDVLVCKINPRINRVWQVRSRAARRQIASSEWIVLRAPEIHSTYLQRYFSSPPFRELLCEGVTGVGGSLTRAQPKRVARFPVPIAPLREQKRVASKLDAILTRIESCREQLDRVNTILKRFRQAVLDAAMSGRLTEEWRKHHSIEEPAAELLDQIAIERSSRGLPTAFREVRDEGIEVPLVELPTNWTWCRVGQIADVRLGGTPSRREPSYWNGDILWVSSGEVANCRIGDTAEKITNAGMENSNAKLYPKGSVLIAMIGEGKTRGQAAILDVDAATNQNVAGLIFDVALVNPEFVWLWALGEYERNRGVGRGGNQPALNGAKVRALPLPLPPRAEQRAIVDRVLSLFAIADRLEQRGREVARCVERLSPVVLARAFRGELVPQDPNDEPASRLLERIRARRARENDAEKSMHGQRARALRSKAKLEVNVLTRRDIEDKHLAVILKERGPLTAEALWHASQLGIDDFYEQLKSEEARGLLKEKKGETQSASRILEAAA
jgi:type I restriction enzyme S subunit